MSWISSAVFGPPGEESGTVLSFIVRPNLVRPKHDSNQWFVSKGVKIILYDLCPGGGFLCPGLGADRTDAEQETRASHAKPIRQYLARAVALLRSSAGIP